MPDLRSTPREDGATSAPDITSRPLLTIAIPTYNRSKNLALLLSMLGPQLSDFPQVELIVSNNASPDDTEQVIERFLQDGYRCRYIRNATNIGADANFLQCYDQAAGKYLWIFGDDDVIFPGTLAHLLQYLSPPEVDLVYVTPFGFVHSPNERQCANPHPAVYAFTDSGSFVRAVGLRGDFALISAIIVNKDRVESFPHPDFVHGSNTNLLQLGWTFTALRHLRRGLVFERGLLSVCEFNPQRPFDAVRIFGVHWFQAAHTYLEPGSKLFSTVINDQLYSWFTTNLYGLRRRPDLNRMTDPVGQMRPLYGHLPLFWIFAWPLLAWPRPIAGAWLALLRGIRHVHRFFNRRLHSPVPAPTHGQL